MNIIVPILFIAGLILSTVASIWLLVVACREGWTHGLLMLFFGWIYAVIFSIMHWEEAKKPFITALVGGALFITPVILTAVLTAKQAPPGRSSAMTCPASASGFKQKLAQVLAAKMAAESSRGKRTRSMGSDANSASLSTSGPVQTNGSTASDPSGSKKSLMTFLSKNITPLATDKPASTSDWSQAHALLRVGGVMQTDNQLFATVNQKVVKVNDTIAVDLNGHLFHFKVRHIDFRHKTVQFEPIGP